jgi:hypothetical protein
MARTKQALKRRAKTHIARVLKLRKRKSFLRGARRRSRNRPHRRAPSAKK